MKRIPLIVLASALATSLGASAASAAPDRIVDGWYAHNATLIMLGAQKQIAGTVAKPSVLPWMFKLVPELRQAVRFPSPRLNAEAVLALDPDITFIPTGNQSLRPLQRVGLNVQEEGFTSFAGMRKSLDDTTRIIDTPLARQRNRDFQQALNKALEKPTHTSARPTVVHVESVSPLRVDGAHSIINEWITAAGGRNAAKGIDGNKQPVSIEQLLEWQPDIIIVGGTAGHIDSLASNPLWNSLTAVQKGQVYRNPAGIFPWDRYGPELLLQLKWASDIIHNGKVDQPRMIKAIQDFYQHFYGISLKAGDARRILAAEPPARQR